MLFACTSHEYSSAAETRAAPVFSQHGRPVPQPWRAHLSGDRSILYKLGYVVTEIGETQRILAHAITEMLTTSSSGALIPRPKPRRG